MLPVAEHLCNLLKTPISLITNYLDNSQLQNEQGVLLLENVRTNIGEKSNDAILARQYASLCDVFVMDAFGTAHRAQASTHGVAEYAPLACAGPLLSRELDALEKSLSNPERPMLAIVGGAKVSSKLEVLKTLATKVDQLIVGGGIANTFLLAAGYDIGNSLCEPNLVSTAKQLMRNCRLYKSPSPRDSTRSRMPSSA